MENDIINILTRMKLFADFSVDELCIFSDFLVQKVFPVNATICEEGELGNEFFIILSGQVQVTKRDNNGKEYALTNMKPGSCFGEMALIDNLPRSASVVALEETKAAILSQASFVLLKEHNMEVYSHILLKLAKEFSNRLRSMDNKYVKIIGFFL